MHTPRHHVRDREGWTSLSGTESAVVRGGGVRDNRIEIDDEKRVSEEVSSRFKRTILRGGEIVLNLDRLSRVTARSCRLLSPGQTSRATSRLSPVGWRRSAFRRLLPSIAAVHRLVCVLTSREASHSDQPRNACRAAECPIRRSDRAAANRLGARCPGRQDRQQPSARCDSSTKRRQLCSRRGLWISSALTSSRRTRSGAFPGDGKSLRLERFSPCQAAAHQARRRPASGADSIAGRRRRICRECGRRFCWTRPDTSRRGRPADQLQAASAPNGPAFVASAGWLHSDQLRSRSCQPGFHRDPTVERYAERVRPVLASRAHGRDQGSRGRNDVCGDQQAPVPAASYGRATARASAMRSIDRALQHSTDGGAGDERLRRSRSSATPCSRSSSPARSAYRTPAIRPRSSSRPPRQSRRCS